ncbi:MAG: DUF433 domain-containing protein [Planctomycetes bacterium]|nr:DUF433 domain-containing protein [Planctomycetota bacterium]
MTTPTTYEHIRIDPAICGGLAHVAGTRVRVIDIVALHERGLSPEEILDSYEHLTLGRIHSALAYSYDHPDAVDAEFRRASPDEDEFRREHAAVAG